MKVSDLIRELKIFQDKHGDVPLFSEFNDGRSTYVEPYELHINFTKPWPDHPSPKKWIIQ